MTGRAEGKVAFITGAARGQGRSHAVRLAQEGADIIAIDICHDVPGALAMATPEDLAETVKLVEAQDRRIVATQADVRDFDGLKAAVDDGVAQLGRLDIVVANAGIASIGGPVESMEAGNWRDTIDINLSGLWHTARAAVPHLIAGGRGGAIVLTSSVGGMKAMPNMSHYVSAKHGVVGLMRSLAVELGQYNIRVNSVHPTNVNTPMFMNEGTFKMFRPDLENPGPDDVLPIAAQFMHVLPIGWVEPEDISNAILFLTSDEARYITGVTLPIDAGALLK
jgi:(+)-trans-carveol dehydrogenase